MSDKKPTKGLNSLIKVETRGIGVVVKKKDKEIKKDKETDTK